MDMPVQEAGGQIIAPASTTRVPRRCSMPHRPRRDLVAADGHAAVIDLTGINIDDLTVPDHQIGRSLRPLRNGHNGSLFIMQNSVFMFS